MPWSMYSIVPRPLLVQFFRPAIRENAAKITGDEVPLETLIPTQKYDRPLVVETQDALQNFRAAGVEVFLMGGSRSPKLLKHTLDALNSVLPRVERVELGGLGNSAPADTGSQPERATKELRRFFA